MRSTPDATAPLSPIGGEGQGEGQFLSLSRRAVLGGLTLFGARALGAPAAPPRALVTVFLRGGVDGLAMVPPTKDPALSSLRGALSIKAPLPLDGGFALHPALAPLLPHFRDRRLAVLHAVGQAQPSRSHFDAQDFLESGTPGEKRDGYLNRALRALPGEAPAFRAVAVQNALPQALAGEAPALAFPSLKDFRVAGGAAAHTTFEALYAGALDTALRTSGHDAFESIDFVQHQGLAARAPMHGARYPASPLGRRLEDVARLLHAEVGLAVAVTEAGGFDTHLAQGADEGQLAQRLKDLGACLAAFAQDLGPRLDDVLVLTVTEFGRTAKENGTRGTDHGTASAMLALGGGVRGGRVYADWPGLASASLFEGRDLAVTTDVRHVLAEALARTLGPGVTGAAFPGFAPRSVGLLS